MREYLEKTLHQNIKIEETKLTSVKLSLATKNRYIFYRVEMNGLVWLAMKPKEEVGLVVLRKDRVQVENAIGISCAVFLNSTTFYIREKLIEEGIPFVLLGKQIYLPFLGFLIANNEREIEPVKQISYLTQKLILTAIYEKWEEVTVSEAAEKLEVSKMSVSRCFDEIEYLNIDILGAKGKSRVITIPEDIKTLWNDLKDIFRNPVIRRFELRDDMTLIWKAGISALCEYTLLSDNKYPTYAITKKEIEKLGIKKQKQIHAGEEAGCVVLELGYYIDFDNKEDPLSVALSLTEEEKQDERIILSVKEMLEEYVFHHHY